MYNFRAVSLFLVSLLLPVVVSAQVTPAALLPAPRFQGLDANGYPLAGGFVYTYAAGTTTALASYTDSTGATPNTNPVVLDSSGRASIWLTANTAYKIVVEDANHNVLYTTENVVTVGGLLTGAGFISYTPARGVARTVAAKLGDTVSVLDYGAKGDGIQNDAPNFLVAQAANPGKTIYFPAGTYKFDNSAAAITVANWNGKVMGDGVATSIACTTLAKGCLVFQGSTGLELADFSLSYSSAFATCNPSLPSNCGAFRNGSQTLWVNGDVNVKIDGLYIHDGPSSAILVSTNSQHVTISNTRVSNMWANGYLVTNSSDIRFAHVSSDNVQDAGIEFSQYDGQAGASSNVTVDGYTSVNDFGALLVNGYTNVTISNWISVNSWITPVTVTQDPTTTTTHWPDAVSIANGLIANPGAGNPPNSAVNALSVNTFATAPAAGFVSHVSLSNIQVQGGNVGANAVIVGVTPDSFYSVNLSDVRVSGASGECFDFGAASISASNLSCEKSGYGYIVRGGTSFLGSNLKVYDVATRFSNHTAHVAARASLLLRR